MILINGQINSPNIPHREKKKQEQQATISSFARTRLKELDEYTVLKNGTTKPDLLRFLDRFDDCSSNEVIAHYKASSTGEMLHKKIQSNACNENRFCKVCANRKTAERWNHLKPELKRLHNVYKNVYLMTFTQKTSTDLYKAIASMQKNFRNWYRLAEHGRDGEYSKIKAGIKSLEVVRGKYSNEWHVHIHFLAFSDKPIDYRKWDTREDLAGNPIKEPLHKPLIIDGKERVLSKLQKEWYQATGNFIVDCKPIRRNKRYSKKRDLIEGAVKEVLKYNTKITNYSADDLATIYDATRGVRHFELTGLLRSFNEELLEASKKEKNDLKEFKKQLQNDEKTKENYQKRINKTAFMQLKYNYQSKNYEKYDITFSSLKTLMRYPDAVEIMQRKQGEIVSSYNTACFELKEMIGRIPNKTFVETKNAFRNRMIDRMKKLYSLMFDTVNILAFKKKIQLLADAI